MSLELDSPTPPPVTRLDWRPELTFADNESIASILTKLEHVSTREVAIVAPPHLRVFRNPVSMRLLQRKAQDLGLDVTIISEDELTRQLCAEIGFACWPRVDAFKRDNSQPRGLEEPAKVRRGGLVPAAAGACLAGLAGFLALFILPAASITVTPASAPLTIDVPVTADASAASVDLNSGRIPAKIVTSGDVEGSTTVNATGQRDVPNQPAHGFVNLTNLTDQQQNVPKSTVALAGNIAFFTLTDTAVGPSLKIGDTPIPGVASAQVQAVDAGEEGNVPAGAITALQGPLASKVSVLNKLPMTGGSKKKTAYLSADDQAKAKQALLEELRRQALDKIHGQIPRNETFLPSPDSNGEGAIQELTYAESPEQVTSQTRLRMKVLIRGVTFQGDDVNQVVAQAMENAARQRGPAVRLQEAPLTIDPPAVIANDGANVKLQVHTNARMIAPLNATGLADKVRGLAPDAAIAALLNTPGVGTADVELWPVWTQKVPRFAWRIHTNIASPIV